MSVSDSGSRVQPTGAGPRPTAPLGGPGAPPPGGPSREAQRRGRFMLIGVLVVFVAAAAWIVTHSGADKPQAGAGAAGASAAGGRGGGRGGRGGRGGGFGGGVTSVGAAQATTGDVPVYLSALGTVTPAATVTVRTQLAGQLFSVAFREGQLVSKGQLLAQVDPRPYQQALLQAQGNLARDQATLANARVDLKRYQTLLSQDSIAKQQVDTQASTVRQNEGVTKTDEAAVAAARLNITYTRITAPIGGKVGLRQVDPGNYVANSDANGLVTITQITPIDVVFTIPEDQVSTVNKRMNTGARLDVAAFDRSGQNQLANGVLSTLDNQIDTTTGTVKAKARFGNGDGALYPNQFVNIRLLVDTLQHVVTAPTSAILRGQDGLFVYVVDGSRTVHIRNVTTGPASGDVTEVSAGLNAGETVVTDGSDRLREGARVLLPGDCPPSLPAGGAGGRGGAGRAGGAGAPGATAKLSWWDKLLGKKAPPAPAAHPGFTADGQRCRTVNFAGGAAGGQGGTAQIMAQLNLDPGQAAKVKTITDASRAQSAALRESGDFAGLRTLRDAMNKQIEAVLRPDQVAKFRQLQAEQRARYAAGGFGGGGGGGQPGAAPAATGVAPVPSAGDRAYAPPLASAGAAPPVAGVVPAPSMAPPAPRGSRGGGLEPGGGRNPAAPPTDAPAAVGAAPGASGYGRGGGAPGGGGQGGRGGSAMFADLGLSPDQQAKIDAVRAQYGPKMREAYQGGDMAAAQAVRAEMGAKMEAVMTPAQRAKFEAARARMRAQGGGGGGPPGGGA